MSVSTRWIWLAARHSVNSINGREYPVVEVDWEILARDDLDPHRDARVQGTAQLPAPSTKGVYIDLAEVTTSNMIAWAKASYPDCGRSHEAAAIAQMGAPAPAMLPIIRTQKGE